MKNISNVFFLLLICIFLSDFAHAQELRPIDSEAASRGFHNLTQSAESGVVFPFFVPGNIFEVIWKVWEPKYREEARTQTLERKRQLAFQRYGFTANPTNPSMPLGFLKNNDGRVTFNCLACHSGSVGGKTYYGVPNWKIDLHTFFEDLSKTSLLATLPLTISKDLFGPERGVIQPFVEVAFSLTFRNALMDRSPMPNFLYRKLKNATANPPAWWTTHKKTNLFVDGSLPFEPRIHITAAVSPLASGSEFRAHEAPMKDILHFADSVKPPQYPGPIDLVLAGQGQKVFEKTCSQCHGTYVPESASYPNLIVPLSVVKTDPERAMNLGMRELREYLKSTWIYARNHDQIIVDPQGYLAPPLDGIWASAPYLHNGSVPTLRDLFYPSERPVVWLADENSYDFEKIGLSYKSFTEIPQSVIYPFLRRRFYDTRLTGRGSGGHLFPSQLSEPDKKSVLEYLRTI